MSTLFTTSKRKHFTTQAHKLYPILIVPSKHLNDVVGTGETEILNVCLPPSNISWLVFVGTVLGSMFWLGRVFKRMEVFQDGGDATGAGAENGRVGVTEVGIETCLKGLRRQLVLVRVSNEALEV